MDSSSSEHIVQQIFLLELPIRFLYTDRMKNKNTIDRTANQLCDLILEIQTLNGNRDFAYAYVSGSLIALIEANRRYKDDMQDMLNRQYESWEKDLEDLKKKKELAAA
jgi:hypothetical protein